MPIVFAALLVAGCGLGIRGTIPQWKDTVASFVKSLGEADPWNWAAFLKAAAGHLGAICGLGAIVAAVHGAGSPLPGWLNLPLPGAPRAAFRIVSGFGVVALVQQGLGLAGLWCGPVLAAFGSGLVAAGLAGAIRRRRIPRIRIPPSGTRAAVCAAAALAVLAFLVARLPDTHDDPRTYHFAAPESFLKVHKIHVEPLNVNWHMPFSAEMLFGLGWAAGDIEGAKLLNLAFLLSLVLATALLARRLAPGMPGAPAFAMAWLLAAGLVTEEWGLGNTDLRLPADVAAAAWCAAEAWTGRRRWWLGAAWCLGLAAGVKFTAGFFVAALAAAALPFSGRPRVRDYPLLALLVLLPVAGWLCESWAWLGNPFHPFLSRIFPDLGWGPRFQRALRDVMVALSPAEARHWPDIVLAPWRAWGDPRMGNLALVTIAPAAFLVVRGGAAGGLLRFLAVAYLLWLPSERNVRYLFPAVPVLAVFAASIGEPARRPAGWGLRLLVFAVFGMGVANGVQHLAPGGWWCVTGQITREAYLDRQFTTWNRARKWVNANVPADGIVFFTGEERRLWFKPRVRSYYTVHEPVFWAMTRDSWSPAEMRKRVRQLGFTHQLHNFVSCEYRALTRHPGPPWNPRQIALYSEFTRRYVRPVMAPDRIDYGNGGFWVFSFDRAPSRRPHPLYFLPLTEGMFYHAIRLNNTDHEEEGLAEAKRVAGLLSGVGEAQFILSKLYGGIGDHHAMYLILHPLIQSGFIGDGSFMHLGGAALNDGHIDEGLAAYLKAWHVEWHPDLTFGIAYGFYRRARREVGEGEYPRALRDLEVAVRFVPDQPSVLFEYARALVRAGRRAEAAAPALRALREAPNDAGARALVAELGLKPF